MLSVNIISSIISSKYVGYPAYHEEVTVTYNYNKRKLSHRFKSEDDCQAILSFGQPSTVIQRLNSN